MYTCRVNEVPSQPCVSSVCVVTCCVQSEDVEESTGIVYPHEEGDGAQPSRHRDSDAVPESSGSQVLIKAGYGQIQVSYDRIEPETGESENVAVEGGEGRGVGGTQAAGEEGELGSSDEGACVVEPGTPVQDEVMVEERATDDSPNSR